MKILMFGWEFPPHISGGLGTACYGLVKGLHEVGDNDVTFVVPRLRGGEDHRFATLLAIENVDTTPCNGRLQAAEADADSSPSMEREYQLLASYIGQYLAPEELVRYRSVGASPQGGRVPRRLERQLGVSAYEGDSIRGALAYLSCVDRLAKQIGDIDVIHAHDWLTFLAGFHARKITGRPLVVHVHSTEFDRAGERRNSNIECIERFGMHMADKVITVSDFTRQVVIDRYGIEANKVVTVHNAAEPDSTAVSPDRSDTKDLLVSFIGRVTHQKGPICFIEAAYRVLQKVRGVKFVLAGSGDLLPLAKSLTRTLGIQRHFEFPGFLDATAVKSLLGRTDLYVMPSVSEPFGIGALEAIHAGVPVIIPHHSGIAEVTESAVKVDAQNTESVASAILTLIENPELAKTLASNAQQEAARLTWKKSAREILAVYDGVLAPRMSKQSVLTDCG